MRPVGCDFGTIIPLCIVTDLHCKLAFSLLMPNPTSLLNANKIGGHFVKVQGEALKNRGNNII